MRQFFSWRIWAAFAAVIGLLVALKVTLPSGASARSTSTSTSTLTSSLTSTLTSTPASTAAPSPPDRRVDFISLVYSVQPSAGFVIRDGLVNGSADFVIDSQRTMHVVAGTLGEITCSDYTQIGQCVVLAQLLGDAVIWFALVPVATGLRVNAPPIVAELDNGVVRLANGWLVQVANTIDRSCKQETDSLSEFLRRFGPESTTVIDVATQRVIQVKCSSTVTATTDVSTPVDVPD
ncbi:MAG TPA: hypothetical protein VGM78_13270, partial [Ilumatobacteraceae bacterium]